MEARWQANSTQKCAFCGHDVHSRPAAHIAAAHRGAQTLVSEPILRLVARKGTGLGPSRCYRPQSRHSARLLGRCVVRSSAPPPRAIGVAAACPHVQGWPGGGGRRAKQLLRLRNDGFVIVDARWPVGGGDSCCLPYAAPSLPPEAAAGGLPGRISALNSKASGPGLRGSSRRPGGRREKALPPS